MKRILYFITGLIVVGSALVACFDEKDFKLDRFTVSDLTPTLHLPLVDDTIRLDVSSDYNVLYDEDGVGYLHFDIKDNILPSVGDFFTVPSIIDIPVSNASVNLPSHSSGNSYSATASYPCTYTFPHPDQQIDSIVFKGGTFTITIAAPSSAAGSYTIEIPELKKDGEAFSGIIPFSGTSFVWDLSGYTLKFKNNNVFDATIGLTILSNSPAGQYNFNSISFSNMEMKSVHGYFGQQQISPQRVELDISTFDKFRNDPNTDLRIKEAFLHFRVDNGAGFPVKLCIDTVVSTASGQPERMVKVDSVDIPANEHLSYSYSRKELTLGGEKLGEVLSNMPSRVEFKFSATINPEGNKNGAVKNFLTDASTIAVSNIEARVPLNFSVANMKLRDTLDFNSSKLTFQDMELSLNVENSMPVAVNLQAYMMDENDNDTGPLFKDPVSIPAATVGADGIVVEPYLYKEKIEANVENLAQTKKLKVEISVNTDNSQYVRVTKDNYVHIKIGAKAVVNVNNLD